MTATTQVGPPSSDSEPRREAAVSEPERAADGRGAGSFPTLREWADVALLALLVGCGLYGFETAYGGTRYLVAGLVGLVLGLIVAFVCARLRQPAIVVAALTVVVFFFFGAPVAVPDTATGGVLPSVDSISALVDGLIRGWVNLLTVYPPVGSSSNLLVVPYVCGLLAGVLALSVSMRSKRPMWALVFPFAVLVLSILFGVVEPASLLVQGAIFAALALGWAGLRARSSRVVSGGSRARQRAAGAVALLAVAGAIGATVGPSLPGADSHERVVLRERAEPPFDPRSYPSPLDGYRRYTDTERLADRTVFRVDGLPSGARIRLATLDSYDGVVFTVGSGAGTSGYFQRVGEEIPNRGEGAAAEVTFTVEDYADVWLPSVGSLESVEFGGPRAEELTDSLQYNLETGVGATAVGLQRGDRYTLSVVIPGEPSPEEMEGVQAAAADQPAVQTLAEATSWADDTVAQASDDRVLAAGDIARVLQARISEEGALSDGNEEEFPSRPGHGARRLGEMVKEGNAMIGNGEQYAALAALMARSLGIPTRVVMGFTPASGATEVKGSDVDAWIEVNLEGLGWVPVDVTPPKENEPQPQPKPKPVNSQTTPPPPPPPVPPMEEDITDVNKVKSNRSKRRAEEGEGGSGIPRAVVVAAGVTLVPMLAIGGLTGTVAGLKLRRRNRRRLRGLPSTRIVGGWHEVTDLATDMGSPLPSRSTRREAGDLLGVPVAQRLAATADSHVFGPGTPDDRAVEAYWQEVDVTRGLLVADLGRFQRWKVLVSPTSLRTSGARHLTRRRDARMAPVTGEPR